MKLLAFQTLREFGAGGYHMALMDNSITNSVHRFVTNIKPG
jgi:hypothetical protein